MEVFAALFRNRHCIVLFELCVCRVGTTSLFYVDIDSQSLNNVYFTNICMWRPKCFFTGRERKLQQYYCWGTQSRIATQWGKPKKGRWTRSRDKNLISVNPNKQWRLRFSGQVLVDIGLCGQGWEREAAHECTHTRCANDACIGRRGVSSIYFYISQLKPNINATVLC